MDHLRPDLLPVLEKTNKDRINHILNEKWIGYPRAKMILEKLDDLLDHPSTHRMPNILLVGDTNNGKTVIVNRFEKKYPSTISDEEEGVKVPVLLIQAPPVPDEKRFYNDILTKLFVPFRINDRVEKKQQQVLHILKHVELKILLIDEIHHILAGTLSRQRVFLNVLKFLSNELQISIVGVGIRDAFHAIQSDPQLSNRFETVLLPTWQMDEEYLRLLSSFESITPLKKASSLTESELATKILSMSEGVLGEVSTIIKKSAIQAIRSGEEKITKKILDTLDYRSPSQRKTLHHKKI
jgi:type II secretory pathway predicted ATPase ExeA